MPEIMPIQQIEPHFGGAFLHLYFTALSPRIANPETIHKSDL